MSSLWHLIWFGNLQVVGSVAELMKSEASVGVLLSCETTTRQAKSPEYSEYVTRFNTLLVTPPSICQFLDVLLAFKTWFPAIAYHYNRTFSHTQESPYGREHKTSYFPCLCDKTDSPKNCPLFLALLLSFGFSLLPNGQSSWLDFRHLHITLCLLSTLISNCTTGQIMRKKGLLDFISDL